MLIVLEGCDGVGKSTLARSLSTILNAEIIHCSAQTPNDMKFFEGIVDASRFRNIIADRFCYGQYVYQDESERPLGSLKELNTLEVKMLDAGVRVVHVTASVDDIEERLAKRGEKCINGLSVVEVEGRFNDLFKSKSLFSEQVILWNTGKEWS